MFVILWIYLCSPKLIWCIWKCSGISLIDLLQSKGACEFSDISGGLIVYLHLDSISNESGAIMMTALVTICRFNHFMTSLQVSDILGSILSF